MNPETHYTPNGRVYRGNENVSDNVNVFVNTRFSLLCGTYKQKYFTRKLVHVYWSYNFVSEYRERYHMYEKHEDERRINVIKFFPYFDSHDRKDSFISRTFLILDHLFAFISFDIIWNEFDFLTDIT